MLKDLKQQIDSSLWFATEILLAKYRQLLYPQGEYGDERRVLISK